MSSLLSKVWQFRALFCVSSHVFDELMNSVLMNWLLRVVFGLIESGNVTLGFFSYVI